MNQVSFMITELIGDPKANKKYFKERFSKSDFTKMSRKEVIEKVGVGVMLNYVKEAYYNTKNVKIMDFDILDKLDFIYDNFMALIKGGINKLILLEEVTLSNTHIADIKLDESDASYDEQSTEGKEEGSRGGRMIDSKQLSVKGSLSGKIRRTFERLKVRDSAGNTVPDKYGYGFDTFVDSDVAVNNILKWTMDVTTIEDMERILKEKAASNPWVNTVLEEIKKEPFRSDFFRNFRKDFTKYSIVTVERDEEGNPNYVTRIINTEDASVSLLKSAVNSFNLGEVPNIIKARGGDIFGRGKLNSEYVTKMKESRLEIV